MKKPKKKTSQGTSVLVKFQDERATTLWRICRPELEIENIDAASITRIDIPGNSALNHAQLKVGRMNAEGELNDDLFVSIPEIAMDTLAIGWLKIRNKIPPGFFEAAEQVKQETVEEGGDESIPL